MGISSRGRCSVSGGCAVVGLDRASIVAGSLRVFHGVLSATTAVLLPLWFAPVNVTLTVWSDSQAAIAIASKQVTWTVRNARTRLQMRQLPHLDEGGKDQTGATSMARRVRGGGADPESDAENQGPMEDNEIPSSVHMEMDHKPLQVKRARLQGEGKTGWIKSIELTDFMCHRHLLVTLSPNINFVTGNNGSGKSAVLTALAVCLGARSSDTNRARSFHGLIREGAESASVKITLCNRGQVDAEGVPIGSFRHDLYGDSIIIEKRFGRTPGSTKHLTYAVTAGRRPVLVTEKREDIDMICDHFGLQVDNPLCLLTQETAKKFLASAKPAELFAFFMKATQLDRLASDYEYSREQVREASERIKAIQSTWAPQEDRIKELEAQARDVARQKDLRKEVLNVKAQMAWAMVADKERSLNGLMDQICGRKTRIVELEAQERAIRDRAATVHEEIVKLQSEYAEVNVRLEPLRTEHNRLNGDLARARAAVQRTQGQIDEMNRTFKEERRNLQRLEEQIAAESSRTEGPGDNIQQRIDVLNEHLPGLTKTLGEARDMDSKLRDSRREALARAHAQKERLGEVVRKHEGMKHQLDVLDQSQGNRLRSYGPRMGDLIKRLEQTMEQFHRQPVGPVGMFVELKEGRWETAIETILGKNLSTFIVKDQHDHDVLQRMFREHGLRDCPIAMIASDAPLDISRGEPDQNFLTPLRVLHISDALVLKFLLIQTGLEKQILVESRDEALSILRSRPMNVDSAFTLTHRIVYKETSVSYQALYNNGKIRQFCMTGAVQRQALEQELLRVSKERAEHQQRLNHLEAETRQVVERLQANETKISETEGRLTTLKRNLLDLETERAGNAGNSLSLATLEEEKQAAKETLETLQAQFVALADQHQAAQDAVRTFEEQLAVNADQQESVRAEADAIMDLQSKSTSFRRDADSDLRRLEAQRETEKAELTTVAGRTNSLDIELGTMREQASGISSRPDMRDIPSLHQLQGSLQRLQTRLDEMAKSQPDPEILARDLEAARSSLLACKCTIQSEEGMLFRLTETIKKREMRWEQWRDSIIRSSSSEFILMLSARDFQGSLLYNKEEAELTISVKPKAQVAADRITRLSIGRAAEASVLSDSSTATERDIRQLSGGEKSYATSCFLFSLWGSMSAPLRALDEFDVFMDQVNRDYVIDVLLRTARSSGVQFILLTPNSIFKSFDLKQDIKVIRLADPVRNQGVLA